MNGIQCVFEKPSDRRDRRNDSTAPEPWGGDAEGRVSTLERSVADLASGQSQIQSAVSAANRGRMESANSQLQQILSMLPARQLSTPSAFMGTSSDGATPIANIFPSTKASPTVFSGTSPSVTHAPGLVFSGGDGGHQQERIEVKDEGGQKWPKLPGFAPPVSYIRRRELTPEPPVWNVRHRAAVLCAAVA